MAVSFYWQVLALCILLILMTNQRLADGGTVLEDRKIPCTEGAQCGNSGCCLHGMCSSTGGSSEPCYKNVEDNGSSQPKGIWTETDLCPCGFSYHCIVLEKTNNIHPKYGPVGSCEPFMR